ncbi:sensor histidine kinase [Mesorhizobium abyssinicae]|uniref:sensor histidine kinase n=1 Tax=Mesorhizobium abyssinicae TaxID=1209958 RepID=UPI00339989F7
MSSAINRTTSDNEESGGGSVITGSKARSHLKLAWPASREVSGQVQLNVTETTNLESVSMLSEFSAYISHEVNQPLTGIALYGGTILRWLAQPAPDLVEIERVVRRMIADAQRASEIVSRVGAAATKNLPEPTRLSFDDGVVREALLAVGDQLKSHGVTVRHFTSLGGGREVLGDRVQLQQVVINLVMNAVQAMAQTPGGKRSVTIRTFESDPANLCCSVEDSGPGIDPQQLAGLFERSFSTKARGMGMGLRICRTVIEGHHGKIGADNKSLHGGARFFFFLPIAGEAV